MAVGGFDDAGVFDSAGPLAGLLGIRGRVEDGLRLAREVDAVGEEANPRREVWRPIFISPLSSSAR